MTLEQLLSLHEETCAACRETMRVKNHDYTSGSVDPFYNFKASAELSGVSAELGIFIRFSDNSRPFAPRDQMFLQLDFDK